MRFALVNNDETKKTITYNSIYSYEKSYHPYNVLLSVDGFHVELRIG